MPSQRDGIAFVRRIVDPLGVSRSENPILSVIVVAYKSSLEIGSCLGSLPRLLNQREVEVLVVDNSPGDGTDAIVAERFPGVYYHPSSENLGFGRANNRGLSVARGDYILFLNPDTVCNEHALSHCLERLVKDPSIGLISPKLVVADGAMDLACRRSIPTLWDGFCRAAGLAAAFPRSAWACGYNLTHLPADGTYDVGAVNGAFMMGPASLLRQLGGFDEDFFMYGDDLDLCIRVVKAGRRIVYDGSVSIVHLKGMSVAKDFERMSSAIFDANRDVFLKHFNPGNSSWVRLKYRAAFGLWKRVARLKAILRGYRRVRPL